MKKILLAFICFFLINAYNSSAQKTVEKKGVSPNFAGFKGVLLIEKCSFRLIERALENKFNRYYKGEFKIVEYDELKNANNYNAQVYPFIISINSDGTSNGASFFKFEMYDRVAGKAYETSSSPDNTIPPYSFINRYAKALEKVRSQ